MSLRTSSLIAFGIILGAFVVSFGIARANDGLLSSKTRYGDLTRAAVMVPGGWTAIACTASSSASSSALNKDTRYWIQCPSAAYIEMAASSATATSSDGYIPAGAILEFATADLANYIACLNVSASEVALNGAGCKIVEVR